MTTDATALIREAERLERFPEFPPRDDMQNSTHLHRRSTISSLSIHFADRPNTLVHSEAPVAPSLNPWRSYRIPDLMVVFDCDVALVEEQWGYAIDRQGKAPDFVLEVASRSTGVVDYTDKRADYLRYGVGEYWRFDPSGGQYHDAALAADNLVGERYEPIEIASVADDKLRGYSEVLKLYVCWEGGELRFYDPEAQEYLQTHEEEREGRLSEREGRLSEREARLAAEARAQAAESEIRRLRGG